MQIKLTESQAGWVEWALNGPISEYEGPTDLCHNKGIDYFAAARFLKERDATVLEGSTLKLPDDLDREGDFIADLLNMLEDLAPDVADGAGYEELQRTRTHTASFLITESRKRSARTAAAKIRKAFGLEGQ